MPTKAIQTRGQDQVRTTVQTAIAAVRGDGRAASKATGLATAYDSGDDLAVEIVGRGDRT